MERSDKYIATPLPDFVEQNNSIEELANYIDFLKEKILMISCGKELNYEDWLKIKGR